MNLFRRLRGKGRKWARAARSSPAGTGPVEEPVPSEAGADTPRHEKNATPILRARQESNETPKSRHRSSKQVAGSERNIADAPRGVKKRRPTHAKKKNKNSFRKPVSKRKKASKKSRTQLSQRLSQSPKRSKKRRKGLEDEQVALEDAPIDNVDLQPPRSDKVVEDIDLKGRLLEKDMRINALERLLFQVEGILHAAHNTSSNSIPMPNSYIEMTSGFKESVEQYPEAHDEDDHESMPSFIRHTSYLSADGTLLTSATSIDTTEDAKFLQSLGTLITELQNDPMEAGLIPAMIEPDEETDVEAVLSSAATMYGVDSKEEATRVSVDPGSESDFDTATCSREELDAALHKISLMKTEKVGLEKELERLQREMDRVLSDKASLECDLHQYQERARQKEASVGVHGECELVVRLQAENEKLMEEREKFKSRASRWKEACNVWKDRYERNHPGNMSASMANAEESTV